MNFPITFEFKVLALSPQFFVRDAEGNDVAYVKQKLFKLKEDITVYDNEHQTKALYRIKANQWIDWSASYLFYDAEGQELGKIGRKGAKSLWKATYELFDSNNTKDFNIIEGNAFVKIIDGVFSEIPVLGFFTGYIFNPTYHITDIDGEEVAIFRKEPSFLGKKFTLNQIRDTNDDADLRIILGLMMMVLLERSRG